MLYWANLETRGFRDGFGRGEQDGRLRGPFREDADCSLYNIHGGLHLFTDGSDNTNKAVNVGSGIIATITAEIEDKRLPTYVAEGDSVKKMNKINSISYLRHCYDALKSDKGVIFVYGHSASDSDAHIYKAIFQNNPKHLYFGIHDPNEEKKVNFEGRLKNFRASVSSNTDFTFFDSASAQVWGTPEE